MLLLRIGDPAQGRAEVDPDPLGRRGPRLARPEAGVIEGQPAGDQAELAEAVELAGRLRRHPGERVEGVDLGGDLRAERARIEPVDPRTGDRPARSPAANSSTPMPIAVMIPIPVIQTRRRSLTWSSSTVGLGGLIASDGSSASASARALNVASVRPAIGRVKTRSTNPARPGRRGRNS